MDSLAFLYVAAALGYLLGSIPFGLLLTRAAGLGDVRNIGSGNIGATNVLRTGYKGLAALTLALDMSKGTAAVFIAQLVAGGAARTAGLIAAVAAFLGHVYPVWLNFRGGKGVATYIGVLAGLNWPAAIVFCAVWFAVALITRYSSLAALTASLTTPLALLGLGDQAAALVFALLTALLYVKHRANIVRLMNGAENKIGARS
jgi:glycerol-3-phosphate acyltransferase PlsY